MPSKLSKVSNSPEKNESLEIIKQKNETQKKYILSSIYLHLVTFTLCIQPRIQLSLKHLNNNSVLYAQNNGYNMFISSIGQMILVPTYTAISSTYGRKSVMLFGTTIAFLTRVVEYARPTYNVINSTTFTGMFTYALMSGSTLMISDLYDTNPKRAAIELSKVKMGYVLATVLAPIPSSFLARYAPRISFLISGILSLINLIHIQYNITETLQIDNRKPLNQTMQMKKINPFSFIELFCHGKKLIYLTIMESLAFVTKTASANRIISLLQRDYFVNLPLVTWNLIKQSYLDTITNILKIPGYFYSKHLFSLISLKNSMYLGNFVSIMSLCIQRYTASPLYHYVVALFNSFNGIGIVAINALLRIEAKHVGIKSDDLEMYLSNLSRLIMAFSQIILPRLYQFSATKTNDVRNYYLFLMVVPLANNFLGSKMR
jgi:MFS family permease